MSSSVDHTRDLIQKYFEALASEAEIAELRDLLVADARAADAFAEAARLHANLQVHFRQQYKIDEIESLLNGTQFVPPVTAIRPRYLRAGSSRHKTFTSKADALLRYGRSLIAVLLLVLAGAAFWSIRSLWEREPRVVAGEITVGGRGVTIVPRSRAFAVRGADSAIIELPDGVRLELVPSTLGALLSDSTGNVLQLDSGGGSFSVGPEQSAIRIETALGTVIARGAKFSLDLLTAPPPQLSPTERLQLPRLVVLVSQGFVTLEHAGVSTTVAAGERYVFPNPT